GCPEQFYLSCGRSVKSPPGECATPSLRPSPARGPPPRLSTPLAPGALTPQGGEVGFERAILLDQFTLTRHVPPPLFGLFDGLAHGSTQFRPHGAIFFEAIKRAALHRPDRKLRVASAEQHYYWAMRRQPFGGKQFNHV